MDVDQNHNQISAEDALRLLIDGNERYLNGKSRPDKATPRELAEGQQPFATILGCSDSRVPPELIFDADPGQLFVIRVAGHAMSDGVAGSLQYAGSHLRTPLFVVMGHEGCGAVNAALAARDDGAKERSRIQLLLTAITPGLPEFNPQLPTEARLSQAVKSNVFWTMKQILESPEGQTRVVEGRMKVVGAVYDIRSGRVNFQKENRLHATC
jgi:carbonic anhydrase